METIGYLHLSLLQELDEVGAIQETTFKPIRQLTPLLLAGASLFGGLQPAIAARLLQYGVSGTDVAQLQNELKATGHFPQSTRSTGYYGPITRNSVIRFQRDRGIAVDGVVGEQTRAALEGQQQARSPMVKQGDRGDRVRTMQIHLKDWGFPLDPTQPLEVDGIFGPNTQAAVLEFQKYHDLRQDGIIGPKTYRILANPRQPNQSNQPTQGESNIQNTSNNFSESDNSGEPNIQLGDEPEELAKRGLIDENCLTRESDRCTVSPIPPKETQEDPSAYAKKMYAEGWLFARAFQVSGVKESAEFYNAAVARFNAALNAFPQGSLEAGLTHDAMGLTSHEYAEGLVFSNDDSAATFRNSALGNFQRAYDIYDRLGNSEHQIKTLNYWGMALNGFVLRYHELCRSSLHLSSENEDSRREEKERILNQLDSEKIEQAIQKLEQANAILNSTFSPGKLAALRSEVFYNLAEAYYLKGLTYVDENNFSNEVEENLHVAIGYAIESADELIMNSPDEQLGGVNCAGRTIMHYINELEVNINTTEEFLTQVTSNQAEGDTTEDTRQKYKSALDSLKSDFSALQQIDDNNASAKREILSRMMASATILQGGPGGGGSTAGSFTYTLPPLSIPQ